MSYYPSRNSNDSIRSEDIDMLPEDAVLDFMSHGSLPQQHPIASLQGMTQFGSAPRWMSTSSSASMSTGSSSGGSSCSGGDCGVLPAEAGMPLVGPEQMMAYGRTVAASDGRRTASV